MATELLKWDIILVGESGVGKTSMLIRYVQNKFFSVRDYTIAVDFLFKDIKVDGINVKLQIWDSAGQERFRAILPQYFRKAHGCILVYDMTDITSFHKLSGWLTEFRTYNGKAPVIIVGNKSEDPNRKDVYRSVIKSYADLEGMDFMECSAKTGEKVEQVFDRIVQKMKEEDIDFARLTKSKKKNKGCC